MRLKNKKMLLSLLMLSSWCYGLTPDEINTLVQDVKERFASLDFSSSKFEAEAQAYLQTEKNISSLKDRNRIIKNIMPKAETQQQAASPDSQSGPSLPKSIKDWFTADGMLFVDALKANNVTNINNLSKDTFIAICRNLYSQTSKSFKAPFWSNFTDKKFDTKVLAERIRQDEKDAPYVLNIPENQIPKFKEILQKLLDGEPLSNFISTPAPAAPSATGVATEQQIRAWVNQNSAKIVNQLIVDGIANSNQITFANIKQAAQGVGGLVLPEAAQRAHILGRLSLPPHPAKLPPPPPKMAPPPPKIAGGKTAADLEREENEKTFGTSAAPTPTFSPGVVPPPPPLPGKGNVPPPPPPPGPKIAATSIGLKLDAAGQQLLVDAIKTKFDEINMVAPSLAPTPIPTPVPSSPKMPAKGAVSATAQQDLINALELAMQLKP